VESKSKLNSSRKRQPLELGRGLLFNISRHSHRQSGYTEQLLLNHHRPLFPEMLQELAQDYDGVVGVDGDAPGLDVGVDKPLLVEKL
jgi:hypothetical protein